MTAGLDAVLAQFAGQARACRDLGSPFTAAVIETLGALIPGRTGALARVADWPGDPTADALALRTAAGLHALVLTESDTALVEAYRARETDSLPDALAAAVSVHAETLDGFLDHPPQTNEVGRSAVLAGGFVTVAADTGLPLRLLEIGASAGLNLLWDRWRYRFGAETWGSKDAPLTLAPDWTGDAPPLGPVIIAGRHGCDLKPIDLEDADARLRLRAYIWPDQPERLARLDAAIATVRAEGLTVQLADAGAWLNEQLAEPADGAARVLYHSIFWQYLTVEIQAAIRQSIADAGAAATDARPFAWLRMEPSPDPRTAELRLTLWPDGQERLLARCHYHGAWVEWLA